MSKVLVLLNIDLSSPKQFDSIDQDLGKKLKAEKHYIIVTLAGMEILELKEEIGEKDFLFL